MRYIRGANNSDITVGIFLLVVLAVFIGPNALPRLLADFVPIADEGTPCNWLKQATERERHQSLVGRAASTIPGNPPLSVQVAPAPLPSDPAADWVIRVTLINQSIGTLPVIINSAPTALDNGQAGLGVSFNTAPVGIGSTQGLTANNIRLLGPRQRCVQRISIPVSQVAGLGIGANPFIKAFYRNNTAGSTGAGIYPDQGIWVGIIESSIVPISFSAGI